MTVIGNHVRTVSNELLGLKRRDFLFIKIYKNRGNYVVFCMEIFANLPKNLYKSAKFCNFAAKL